MADPTPEDIAFAADMDRLRAAVGPAALVEEAARRGIGDAMLNDALNAALEANTPPLWRTDASCVMWSEEPKPNWGWTDE